MTAKHYYNGLGVAIHTDRRLDSNETRYRYFLDELEEMDGVEKVSSGRYSVDVMFAFLFPPREMCRKVLELFEKVYQTSAGEEISGADVHLRLMQEVTAD